MKIIKWFDFTISKMVKDLIIFGSKGMLGNTLYHYFSQFKDEYNVVGISRKEFDVGVDDNSLLYDIITENSVVINCVGMIPQKYSQSDFKRNYIHINGTFPYLLELVTKQKNGLFIHISTDCVFNGKGGNYGSNETPTEEKIYGFSKSCGESKTAMVIRTSIIGEEKGDNKSSLLEWVRKMNGKECNGYTDHIWNGVCCLELSKIIHFLLKEKITWKGVKHITSDSIVSKYSLLVLIKDVYNLKIELNPIVTGDDVDKSLASDNDKLKIKVRSLTSQLKEQKEFWEKLEP